MRGGNHLQAGRRGQQGCSCNPAIGPAQSAGLAGAEEQGPAGGGVGDAEEADLGVKQVASAGAQDGGDGFFGGERALGEAADAATGKAGLLGAGGEAGAIRAVGRKVVALGHVGAVGLGGGAERVGQLQQGQAGAAALVVDNSQHLRPQLANVGQLRRGRSPEDDRPQSIVTANPAASRDPEVGPQEPAEPEPA